MDKNFISINDLKKNIFGYKEAESNNSEIVIEDIDKNDIAIIGISCKFAEAEDVESYWNLLKDGRDGIREIPYSRKKDADKYYEQCGVKQKNKEIIYGKLPYLNEVDKFDYDFFQYSPIEAKIMDPKQRVFLETAWNALEDSGYGVDKFVGTKTGIYLGLNCNTFGHGYESLIDFVESSLVGTIVTGNLKSITASRLSYILDLKGPSMVIDTACSSSLVAVHVACQAIRNGECEMALAGGVNLTIFPSVIGKDNVQIGIESSDFKVKTFDDTSDGTNGGEGVAAILLKPLDKAIEDNDNIYAVIKGSAINQDGTSVGITAPNVKSQENVILDAWREANINPETISYIEAHGTGTKLGDPIEVKAIQSAFRKFTDRKQFCAIGSVKTNIGHTDSLAGLSGLIKAVMALKNKKIPASLNFKVPNRNINFAESPVYVNDRLADWEQDGGMRRCGVSSFGMSGTNCHIVLEEAPKVNNEKNENCELKIIALSAKNAGCLKNLVGRYMDFVNREEDFNLDDVCYVANTGRRHYRYRICIVVKSKEEFKKRIEELNGLDFEKIGFNEISDIEKVKLMELVHYNVDKFLQSGKQDEISLEKICELYKKGIDIPWDKLYREENRKKISIPTYPFERKRCWIEIPKNESIDFKFINTYKLLEKDDLPQELASEMKQVMEKYREYIEANNDSNETNIKLKGRVKGSYTENEKNIASEWNKLTGYEEVNIFDNFFDMGIDSIQAITFLGKLRINFNVTLNDIYEYPTISSLAENIQYNHENLKKRLLNIKNITKASDENNGNMKFYKEKLEEELSDYQEKNRKYDLVNVKNKNQYNEILLTGATGHLGIHILYEVLTNTKSNIYVLVRSNKSNNAIDRLKEKIRYYFDESIYHNFGERIFVIDGDLTKEYFGMSQDEYVRICNKVDCIIHPAANVQHYGDYFEFDEINVKGTERLLRFAKEGIKKDFNHISTTYLAPCKSRNNGSIMFSEYDDKMISDIENYYLYSKAEAEKLVIEARKQAINTNIFRVGNIVFNSRDGKFQSNINENAFYLMMQAFIKIGIVPDLDIEIECSFVDYISRAIVLLFNTKELNNETYHICNSTHKVNITNKLPELGLGVKKVSIDDFLDYIYKNYQNEKVSKYIQNLITFLFNDAFQNGEQSNSLPISTVSSKTEKILSKLGFEWVEINEEHFKKMMRHCEKVKFL